MDRKKGAAFITALVTLISGTLSATLGLGVATGILSGFGEESASQAELNGFVEDVNGVCESVQNARAENNEDITIGTVTGALNLKNGQELTVEVGANSASISGTDLETGEDTAEISCDIVNEEDVTYSEGASYMIYPRIDEGGVSLG